MRKVSLPVLISVLLAGPALGSEAVPNWHAPASWTPPGARGATTLSETPPVPFIPITPCRVADTRGNGFGGAYGPPSLSAGVTRNFTITGQCGIPPSAAAVSFNFAVTNLAQNGNLVAWPTGTGMPVVSSLNWTPSEGSISNAAVIQLSGAGGMSVFVNGPAQTVDLIIDVNGYYANTPATAGNQFVITNDVAGGGSGAGVIVGHNTDANSANSWGGQFISDSCNAGSAGVFGIATSAPSCGAVFGIWGRSSSTFSGSSGVVGEQLGNQVVYGVYGTTSSTFQNAAGVFGVDGSGALLINGSSAGVRGGSATGNGVLGVSRDYAGVYGTIVDSLGNPVAAGVLGSHLGVSMDVTGPPWGVFAFGTLGATGAKHFVEPHPADPSKMILYSSLEGREVGTYFRGTARTAGRKAVIDVPEDFRIVTDEEGLTVQLTPVGPLTTMSVESEDLNRIVVRSSQDVAFHYLVQGVRRAFKNFEPVVKGTAFAPSSPEETMPGYLTEEAKRRLIANGTYNGDGTVNMETAERLGWTKIWADREAQAKTAAAANAAARAARPAETQ